MSTGSGGAQDIKKTQLRLGSDIYGKSLQSGCIIGGVMLTNSNQEGDIYSPYYGKFGHNETETNSLGIYSRYINKNNWYSSLSVMKYVSNTDLNLIMLPKTSTDSHSWAISFELGREMNLAEKLALRLPAQAIYQKTKIDDIENKTTRISYDTINTQFFRAGFDLNFYTEIQDKATKLSLVTNIWHQPKGEALLSGYNLINTKYIGYAQQPYGMTWGELGGSLQMSINKNTSINARLNYHGKFDNTNNLYSVEVGLQYRW